MLSKLAGFSPGVTVHACAPQAVERVRTISYVIQVCYPHPSSQTVRGWASQEGPLLAEEGIPSRVLVLCSATGEERSRILLHYLRKGGHEVLSFPLPDGAPTVANVKKAVDFAKRVGCEGFVGFGGGGMMNVTKVEA